MEHIGTAALDVIATATVAVVTSASTVILAVTPDPTDELKLLLIPLIGALLASLPTVLLYPERETRSIVIGRASLALILATLLPQTLAIMFTSTSSFFAHPVIGLGSGVVGYIMIYIPIRSLFEGLYKRRKAIAEAVIEKGEQRLIGNVREAVGEAVETKFQDTDDNPVVKRAQKIVVSTAATAAKGLKETASVAAEELKQVAQEAKAEIGAKTQQLLQ